MKTRKTIISLFVLALSTRFVIAQSPPGQVVGWGDANGLQIDGFATPGISVNLTTIAADRLTNVVRIAADDYHSLALKDNGTVFGWGANSVGEAIGVVVTHAGHNNGMVTIEGRVLTNVVSIATGNSFGLALKRDGTVVAWGKNKVPPGLTNVAAIDARGFFSLALRKDGTVIGWANVNWTEAHVPPGLSNVTAVAIGGSQEERSLALKQDGTVVAWGRESIYHESAPPAGLSDVIAIAAGETHSLALRKDGTMIGWGLNGNGEATGVPNTTDPYVSSGVVTVGGQVVSNVVAIAARSQYNLAVKRDGTVIAWGNKRFYKEVPPDLSGVVAISAGDGFCLAITTNSARVNK